MSRYIDAEWLMNFFVDIPNNFTLTIGNLRATVNDAPSIDIEPKRGEWKIEETKSVWGKGYMLTCSECGDTFRVTENALSHEHFCRNCGADMRKESER